MINKPFARSAPTRRHQAELNAVRMQGFTQGYKEGLQAAPFAAPPALFEALDMCHKTRYHDEKVRAALRIVAILNEMIMPGNEDAS